MPIYVVDTHALVWFLANDSRLSLTAKEILQAAERSEAEALVPTIVLAELVHIAERHKAQVSAPEVLKTIHDMEGFLVVPLDLPIVRRMPALPSSWDIHDRIIASTALHYAARLLTRDKELHAASQLEAVW